MSYDLNVFGSAALSARELARLAASGRKTKVVTDPGTGEVLAVLNRRSGAHAYTVEGPFVLDPEDLEEWGEANGLPVLYSIAVLSSDEEDRSNALRFAEALALKARGHVVDLQTYSSSIAGSPSGTPQAVPETEARYYLHVTWNRLRDGASDFAADYLAAARELYPAAMPMRFGTQEPLQGRLDRGDETAFERIYRDECAISKLFFTAKALDTASITGWNNDHGARFQSIRLTFPFASIEEPGMQDFIAFFVEVARRTSSFFAFAEPNSSRFATASSPAFKGGWGGLPRTAQWMTWYSPEYMQLVRPFLTSGVIVDYPEGSLHTWTPDPATARELRPLIRRAPWVASELLATLGDDADRRIQRPAESMPSAVRAPAPGSAEAERIAQNIAANRARAGLE